MIDSALNHRKVEAPGVKSRWKQRGILGAVCALVIGVYAYTARSGFLEGLSPNAADTYYNLLVQGFRAGQLSLKIEVPPGLAQLADPYDPTANALYRLVSYKIHDMSYYKGRLFLYFGVTPALILFWPYVALTGHYLFHRQAVVIFCAVGFLASVGLLRGLWQRYFAEVSVGVVAACALALGLATLVPVMLSRSDTCEVPISCGYMLTMLALGAIWCALHQPGQRCQWLAAASAAYGLALGARPSLLLGAVILLAPVIQARREGRQIWTLLIAAAGPIAMIGIALMLYNNRRFDSPFEFGLRYQLAPDRHGAVQYFGLHYLWFNFRAYFLEPVRWGARFPFVHEIAIPPVPAGHGTIESPFGVLTNIPLVWLAVAVPLAWRSRPAETRSILCGFLAAVTLLLGLCVLTLDLFFATCMRYEVEFLPALVLLAAVGILGLERMLVMPGAWLANQRVWRRVVRWGWGLLLGFSIAFNLLATVEHYAQSAYDFGVVLAARGRVAEAIQFYEEALRIEPDHLAAHNNLGVALRQAGRVQEAIGHYEQALRMKPDFAEVHYNLGVALEQAGKVPEAIGHYEQALRIKPDYAEAHYNLGSALARVGKVPEAMVHWKQALKIKPDYAEAHYDLGVALVGLGRVTEAMGHWEQAVRIEPEYAEAHYNLGVAFEHEGRIQEAIGHYEQALRIRPDYAEAQNRLARLRAVP